MAKGSLEILVNEVAEKVNTKNEEDDLLKEVCETQKKLQMKLQEVENARQSRKSEEDELKATLLKLRVSIWINIMKDYS